MNTVEQRFLRGPSLWSGKSCLVSVVDMGPMAHALTTDIPGLGERLLALLPGMHDFAGPLKRGSFIAEVVGRMALELQRIAGAPATSRCAITVQGRQSHVKIIIASQVESLSVHAFELATSIMAALYAGKKIDIRARLAALKRIVRLRPHPTQPHKTRWPRPTADGDSVRPSGLGRMPARVDAPYFPPPPAAAQLHL